MSASPALALLLGALLLGGCAGHRVVRIETTAYCGCGDCCSWERGSWKFLKLDFWNRYVSAGRNAGAAYSGKTASGTSPHEPRPGLVSLDTLTHPWMFPVRLLFPWLWLPRDGTVAADTDYYPFGTRLWIAGYGYGVVEDRGGAIRGPRRLDLYFRSHRAARRWGRRQADVKVFE